jgi:hypothetical protein
MMMLIVVGFVDLMVYDFKVCGRVKCALHVCHMSPLSRILFFSTCACPVWRRFMLLFITPPFPFPPPPRPPNFMHNITTNPTPT